jgi:hypothetical protein
VTTSLNIGGAERMPLHLLGAPPLADTRQAVVSLLPEGTLAAEVAVRTERFWQLNLLSAWDMASGLVRLAALVERAGAPRRAALVWGIRQSLASLDGENAWASFAIRANRL